jgi:ATP-dependent DNA ligase
MSKIAVALPKVGRFIPTMQPSYAAFDETIEAHGGKTFADIKYDGYRVQVHKSSRTTKIFTRNGEQLNYACYPDIMGIVDHLPTCIIDAELVGEGTTHNEVFSNVRKRFRRQGIKEETIMKYLESRITEEVPLSLRVFDTLKFERSSLINRPLEERRSYTECFDAKGLAPSETQVITSVEALEALVEETFRKKEEGRVCKDFSSLYLPGKQTIDWVKFKRSEQLDLVVVGFYKSEDYCTDLPFTSVLVAAYNDKTDTYETMGKIGATRDGMAHEIYKEVKAHITQDPPANLALSEKLEKPSHSRFLPQAYIDPESSVVLEVNVMNINYSRNWQTCGLKDGKAFSMRIGYASQLRYDKDPAQSTKTSAIKKLYKLQEKGEKR